MVVVIAALTQLNIRWQRSAEPGSKVRPNSKAFSAWSAGSTDLAKQRIYESGVPQHLQVTMTLPNMLFMSTCDVAIFVTYGKETYILEEERLVQCDSICFLESCSHPRQA